jgi:hypothetical protein
MLTRYFYCTLVLICLFLTACQPPTVDPAAVVAAVNQTLTVQAFGQVQTAFAQTQTAFGKNPVSGNAPHSHQNTSSNSHPHSYKFYPKNHEHKCVAER